MTAGRAAFAFTLTLAAAVSGWLLFFVLPAQYAPRPALTPEPAVAAATAPSQGRKIRARLFYVAESGVKLASVEREVPYGEGTAAQAKAIINAQMAPPAEPLVSAVPAGTSLRALFVTDRGEAFVDLSREFTTAHAGGSLNELLTVHTLVSALTVNLPTITGVQLLVDGKPIDTLAGHVDLRRSFAQNPAWIEPNTPNPTP